MIYKGCEIFAEAKPEGAEIWSLDDDGYIDERVNDADDVGDLTYFVEIDGERLDSKDLSGIKLIIDRHVEPQPEFVQDLTGAQGIGIVHEEHAIEDGGLSLLQFYGHRSHCDSFAAGECSYDGNLWRSGDGRSPFICTAHAFPQEQLGYEFYAVEEAA